MNRLFVFLLISAGLVSGFGINPLQADDPGATNHVSGQGQFDLKRQPEFLRVHVDVLAKARSAKDALVKLQERRQYARGKLESMGAAAESIEFGEPAIVTESDPRERQMQAMMWQQAMMQAAQGGKKPAAKGKEAPPVVVSCSLKAQIRLTAPNPEDMLLLTHGLEERIKAADIGGLKALKQASPQDEEMMQEQMQAMGMAGEEQHIRGQPIFMYVSKISAEDRSRAVREAFKRAERQASELAAAAGLVLGPVHHLEETPVPGMETETVIPIEMGLMRETRMAATQIADDKAGIEAIGAQPSKVVYRVALTASFELRRIRPR